ncbi:MAG: NADH-quinone oxidoreductase subunit NuoK [Amoebophilaceae bacterium]|nr:NADH-quinone oxidoreductase subunit NuoK [Amoebophilaceae bacterium]
MPPPPLLILSALVFAVGTVVVLTKQNVLFVLIGVELMLSAACFDFVLFSSYDPKQEGQVFVLFFISMIVCETAVALAIILKVYQYHQSIDTEQLQQLREK